MSNNSRKPWERRDDETDAQWLAFRIYRDLGLGRTVEGAWRKYADKRGLKTEQATDHFWQWYNENDWDERTRAWDDYQDRQHRAEVLKAQREATKELAERSRNAAILLAAKATGRLRHIREKLDGGIDEFDRTQLTAIRDLLDRIGVGGAAELVVDGSLSHRHDHEHEHEATTGGVEREIAEAIIAHYQDLDEQDLARRADELDRMEEELTATHWPDEPEDDGEAGDSGGD